MIFYKSIGDELSKDEFNAICYMLREKNDIKHEFSIKPNINIETGYGDLYFNIGEATVLDNGIQITRKTLDNPIYVTLSNPVFDFSSYSLVLTILKLEDLDYIPTSPKDYDSEIVEIDLENNVPINLLEYVLDPFSIISLDVVLHIKHDKPEIRYFDGLRVLSDGESVEVGEEMDIYAELMDNIGREYDLNDYIGTFVHFFEVLNPTIVFESSADTIQSGDSLDFYALVRDEDGSLAKNVDVYFYEKLPYDYFNDGTDLSTLHIWSNVSVTVVDRALKITTSTSGEKYVYYEFPITSSDNLVFECEVAEIGEDQPVAMYVRNASTSSGFWFAYSDVTELWYGAFTGSSFSNVDLGTLKKGDKIRIKQENRVITAYCNDNVIYSKTSNFSGTYYIGHYTNQGRIQYIKNIKIIKEGI